MNKPLKTHRIIATFFLLIFFPTLFPVNLLYASNNGLLAPEAASFEPVDATDMVNLATGDMSYVLPLLNVPSPEGGYPLALSYHAGIALNQESSWVGLGWNLNPGAINRTVNNSPDDCYDARTINFIYSNLGSQTVLNIGVGMKNKISSAGLNYTFINGKAYGGVVSFKANGLFNTSIGFGGNSDFHGFGVGGIQFSTGKTGQNFSLGLIGIKKSSTGISFSSSNPILGAILSQKNNSSLNTTNLVSVNSNSFNTSIPIPISKIRFDIKISGRKTNLSIFDTQTSNINGALYLSKSYRVFDENKSENYRNDFMDATSIDLDFANPNESRDHIKFEPPFPCYDNYAVSAQGMTQNIQPLLFDSKTIILSGKQQSPISTSSVTTQGYHDRYHIGPQFTNQFMPHLNSETNKIHFYPTGTCTSFIKNDLSDWTYNNTIQKITDISSTPTSTSILNNDNTLNGYNANKNRLKKETFIETFTNEQILNNSNLIIEGVNFDRNYVNNIAPKGIGAFKITSIDGKIYHYSIPVYNYELFMKSFNSEDGENNNLIEKIITQPFATHWLLTAITGPDYIDVNSNGETDHADYGYWVNFEYGKWTDSFVWERKTDNDNEIPLPSRIRNQHATSNSCFDIDNKKTSSHAVGIKEIYYLNAINSRSHSALFIKSVKNDDFGNSYAKSRVFDDGVQGTINYSSDFYAAGAYFTESDYHYNVDISGKFKTLKLDKIVLIKSDEKHLYNLPIQQEPENTASNQINLFATTQTSNILGQDLGNVSSTLHYRNWISGTYKNNIYTLSSINYESLISKSIKVIEFKYDYSLSGKMSLKALHILGHKGEKVTPPYTFEYYNSRNYNSQNYDLWGYDKKYSYNFSLRSINNPIGGKIEIIYESDDFEVVLENLSPIYNEENIKPIPKKFIRNNDGFSGSLELKWCHPCYSINQTYKCISIGNTIEVVLKKDGIEFQTNATITSINYSANIIYLSFTNQIPSLYTGDFYCCEPHQGISTNCSYSAKLNFYNCDVNNELIGKCDDSRGGLRVSQIIVSDNNSNNNRFIQKYDYNIPDSNLSSGVTASTPYVDNPYSFMFNSGVIYEFVTVSVQDKNNQTLSKSIFKFNVIKPDIDYDFIFDAPVEEGLESHKSLIANYSGFYRIRSVQKVKNIDVVADNSNSNNYLASTSIAKTEFEDHTSKIGELLSITELNSKNQILAKKEFKYSDSFIEDYGTYSEAFKSYKSTKGYSGLTPYGQIVGTTNYRYYINSSNLKVLSSRKIEESVLTNNNLSKINYVKYDFLNGNILELTKTASNGIQLKTKSLPAYIQYPQMGSKVDDINNKNMLSQVAANYTYILDNEEWKTVGVGITTWNNEWAYKDMGGEVTTPTLEKEKVWRKHKNYIWNGSSDENGIYENFQDNFNWGVGAVQTDVWKQTSEVTLYDHYSMPLEMKDINNNYACTKMGDNDSKVIAVGNARYTEMFYAGAENIKNNYLEPEIRMEDGQRSSDYSHTGKYSVKATSSTKFGAFMKADQHGAGRYKLSVWVHKDNVAKARVRLFSNTSTFDFNGESVTAGDWVLKTHYFEDVPTGEFYPYVNSIDGTEVYFDDFKLHPVASSVTGYVYNEYDELTYIIGNNGLATKFEYDAGGRLTKTYTEIIDDAENNIVRGFKLANENKIIYKNL
jgi:hypothetical protein